MFFNPTSALALLLASVLSYNVVRVIYNIVLHPLAKYDGPLSWRALRFPFVKTMVSGDLPHRIKRLHEQYGPIVRVAPDELSFTDPAAWRDIYPQNFQRPREYKDKPPRKSCRKSDICQRARSWPIPQDTRTSFFSEKSVYEQEAMIKGHVDLLIRKLHQTIDTDPSKSAAVVDALQWCNYATFDVIGDFIWGSSFKCLDQVQSHPWIQVIAQFKVALIVGAFKFYPPLDAILTFITPKSAMADLWMIWKTTENKISERLTRSKGRKDVMSYMIAANKASSEYYMSRDEMEINAMLLVIAGSESVTTALLGATHYLLREPAKLQILVREIRSTYPEEDDITGISLNSLPYLNAVLQEALRLCPTIPDGMRREIPKGGAAVAGHFLPEGTVVSIPQWATYQSPRNYYKPAFFYP
ncbi:hypothetical protein N7G274_008771 [Stereocaulon virgatum]|uniref:Cytochrome P450 n=1 Tax=Stereocaulon virgatum TaxID=373712 RepID=A0ABR4A245_9LECA